MSDARIDERQRKNGQAVVDMAASQLAAKNAEIAALTKERDEFDRALQERINRHSSEIGIAVRQITALREALKMFATFGLVEEGTATVDDIRDGLMRDRICDWFGPSDFDAARAALEMSGGVK